ncbi:MULTISPECIES: NUDIX hydrolase [Desulfococcus]|uniref:NUDIX hydrolase n=1 Tax=Desulfococcus multivorans DSM 2059 TaxID=1121405 RepID=S7TW79_DESML|nr:CoA pyrophosphatase [Desulfococcus multivorans]AOY58162.1 conserved uncharacterized protein [Desulfococcus multivorans]AQV00514.1 coenzyme A pyrophosphatase [Desulfococcus multivorans]EPR41271.1 hypothetical protein dsmv_2052 [Desulfococcus multivorans DSM 2059]SJZ74309.1 hypothetical protein SAMN02745446_01544 [Desulfococcus multivorans DSM 2059]
MNLEHHVVSPPVDKRELLDDPGRLLGHISRRLFNISRKDYVQGRAALRPESTSSAVLLLIGSQCGENGPGPCLILNKRSDKVRQPGDICCPGGGITPALDGVLSKMLTLPGMPLKRWAYWPRWQDENGANDRAVSLLLATGLREGFEEMRLNPMAFRFLGPMPPSCLRLFRRKIYPMVGWISRQQRFRPNREVDRIIHVPLEWFWEKERYANYHVSFSPRIQGRGNRESDDFPCFMFESEGRRELLWGVTYRIIMKFMASVFEIHPPDPARLPVISGRLRRSYITGK